MCKSIKFIKFLYPDLCIGPTVESDLQNFTKKLWYMKIKIIERTAKEIHMETEYQKHVKHTQVVLCSNNDQ